jgi:S1-C subfamily serine protease
LRQRGGAAALVLALIAGAAGGGVAGAVAATHMTTQAPAAPGIAAGSNEQRGAPAASAPASAPSSSQSGASSTVAGAVYNKVNRSVVQIANGQGAGSGFVVDQSGLILTNNHVVEGADSVVVIFSDGTKRQGQVLGADSGNDLAVVKVALPANVTPVALGDSDKVQVGETAIAIGSPFGLDQTVTQGIISAVHRDWAPGDGSVRRNLIQSDTPINPGNSGGPLLNANGEVIGINTMIESPVRGSVGVGFSIPINTAKALLPKLAAGAQIEPAWLGITGQSIDADVAQQEGLAAQSGVLVREVVPGAPAEQAGLEAGDVIAAIDGRSIVSMDELVGAIAGHTPGDTVKLTVDRGGRSQDVGVTLQARPEQGG